MVQLLPANQESSERLTTKCISMHMPHCGSLYQRGMTKALRQHEDLGLSICTPTTV